MTQRGRLVETLARAETGPIMAQEEFEQRLLPENIKKAIHDYQIEFDRETVVNSDDDVADRLFQAGFDVAAATGFFCQDTSRRIVWTREEIEEGLRWCPSEVTFGLGVDAVTFRTRKPEDSNRVGIIGGAYGVPVPEDMYVPMALSYLKEPLFDIVDNPSLETVYGHPVKAGTAWEVLAARREAELALMAANIAGRPGMALGCVQMSPTHLGHLSGATWGAYRPSDYHQVTTISEFKVNHEILSRAIHVARMGGGLQPYYNPIYGGYVGGAEGVAVAIVAALILLNQNLVGHVYQTRPTHPFNGSTTTPELIWAGSVAVQALARNTNLIVATLLGPSGGPGEKSMLYENAAFHLANTVSGQAVATGAHSAGGAVARHASGLDAKIFAEVVHAAIGSGIDRVQANDLVKQLLARYEPTLDEMPRGRPFEEVYDLVTIEPTPEWQGTYDEVRDELIELGLPLDRLAW
jgi:methylamine--corrinoid protein Co-methyltransferase